MWCYLPETDCLFAAEPVDWIWASVSPIPAFTHDALSNGKNTPGKASSPHSAPDTSYQRRSGTTSPHSTQSPSEAHSIPYLPGIPASHLATPANAKAPTTPATSGHTLPGSSENLNPDGCSSKTLQDTSPLALRPCCENYGAWVTRLRLAHSQRLKLAQRTSASDGSAWPTAQALTGGANSQREARGAGGPDLQEMAQNWPTPMAGTPAQNGNSAAGNNDFTRRAEELATAMWFTPDVPNGGRTMPKGATITGMKPDGSKAQIGLENQAKLWGTPRASDAEKGGPNMKFGSGGTPLPAQAAQWPTPAAHEPRLGVQNRTPGSKESQISLSTIADRFSHPDQTTPQHGKPHWRDRLTILRLLWAWTKSRHGRSVARRLFKARRKKRLNPLFVEWLMGWPPGHALCDCSETEFAQFQQRMRGALSALPTAYGPWIWKPTAQTTPEPTQKELF